MKQEKIIEENKLIAEFMGAYIAKEGQQAYDMDNKFPNGKDRQMPEVMKYHSSWDWLMPVIERCLTEITYSEEYEQYYSKIHDALWSINISSVYNEVIEFIKWYNLKKKK